MQAEIQHSEGLRGGGVGVHEFVERNLCRGWKNMIGSHVSPYPMITCLVHATHSSTALFGGLGSGCGRSRPPAPPRTAPGEGGGGSGLDGCIVVASRRFIDTFAKRSVQRMIGAPKKTNRPPSWLEFTVNHPQSPFVLDEGFRAPGMPAVSPPPPASTGATAAMYLRSRPRISSENTENLRPRPRHGSPATRRHRATQRPGLGQRYPHLRQ